MEPSFASKHDVVVGNPLLLSAPVPCALPAHPCVPAMRATSAAKARADGVKNRFPLHFMAKAEWNGRTDGLRAVRVAADGSSAVGKGRLAGRQGAEEEGEECPFGV